MKPDKHFITAAGIVVAAACLIALTWIATLRVIYTERVENTARVTSTLANQALTFSEQINRQLLGLDQTLRILVTRLGSQSAAVRSGGLAYPLGRAERPQSRHGADR